jgi:hypothetical protein
LQHAFGKKLEVVREAWLKNVRQVIEAPLGVTVLTIPPEVSISSSKTDKSTKIKIVNDPNANPVFIKEEDIRLVAPLDYGSLTAALRERYIDFIVNTKYHKIKKSLESSPRYCRVRQLDPNNPKSPRKCFYSTDSFEEFDKHYIKRSNSK